MSQGRILVIEDDPDIVNLLRFYFESLGFDVSVAQCCLLYTSPSPRDS